MITRRSIASRIAGALAGIAVLLGAVPASAADFILYSQNILRFGHGKRTATQCAAIGSHILTVDIILIQELMVSTTPCTASVLPGTYVWKALGPYGAGSYYEYYGFLYSSTARASGPKVSLGPKTAAANPNSYSRPPQGILFEIIPNGQTTAKRVWIANFHAVWGKNGITPRRNEATAASTFATFMAGMQDSTTGKPYSTNVIVAGDWNLPATDSGFNGFTNNTYSIQQTALTSIARSGAMSQSYDHFAVSPTITVGTVSTVGAGNPTTWRQTVSDHLGVQMEVTLP
jgi:hypothetical protein